MNHDLRKLMEEYKDAVYMNTRPEYIKKLSSKHIEDEEKSVNKCKDGMNNGND